MIIITIIISFIKTIVQISLYFIVVSLTIIFVPITVYSGRKSKIKNKYKKRIKKYKNGENFGAKVSAAKNNVKYKMVDVKYSAKKKIGSLKGKVKGAMTRG